MTHEMKTRTRACGVLALCAAAAFLSGCQTQTRLTPAAGADTVSGLGRAASVEMQNVSILVESEAWGGDRAIEQTVRTMYEQEPSVRQRAGIDPALFEDIGQANRAARD